MKISVEYLIFKIFLVSCCLPDLIKCDEIRLQPIQLPAIPVNSTDPHKKIIIPVDLKEKKEKDFIHIQTLTEPSFGKKPRKKSRKGNAESSIITLVKSKPTKLKPNSPVLKITSELPLESSSSSPLPPSQQSSTNSPSVTLSEVNTSSSSTTEIPPTFPPFSFRKGSSIYGRVGALSDTWISPLFPIPLFVNANQIYEKPRSQFQDESNNVPVSVTPPSLTNEDGSTRRPGGYVYERPSGVEFGEKQTNQPEFPEQSLSAEPRQFTQNPDIIQQQQPQFPQQPPSFSQQSGFPQQPQQPFTPDIPERGGFLGDDENSLFNNEIPQLFVPGRAPFEPADPLEEGGYVYEIPRAVLKETSAKPISTESPVSEPITKLEQTTINIMSVSPTTMGSNATTTQSTDITTTSQAPSVSTSSPETTPKSDSLTISTMSQLPNSTVASTPESLSLQSTMTSETTKITTTSSTTVAPSKEPKPFRMSGRNLNQIYHSETSGKFDIKTLRVLGKDDTQPRTKNRRRRKGKAKSLEDVMESIVFKIPVNYKSP